jgi:UDP-N-acetyl-D-mannosaminuronic acid transferase (WecB/TagA/CpsF family)
MGRVMKWKKIFMGDYAERFAMGFMAGVGELIEVLRGRNHRTFEGK